MMDRRRMCERKMGFIVVEINERHELDELDTLGYFNEYI